MFSPSLEAGGDHESRSASPDSWQNIPSEDDDLDHPTTTNLRHEHFRSTKQSATNLPDHLALQADRLRDELCLTRVQGDCERDRLLALYDLAQNIADKRTTFAITSAGLQQPSQATIQELQRLEQQAQSVKRLLQEQIQATQRVERKLRKIEARIARLGVWFVHIPDIE